MKLRPDEEFARELLRDYLREQFGGEPVCEGNEEDPPDLVATLPSGVRWGVEVTQAYQQVSRPDEGKPVSSETVYVDLKRWADAVGKRTAGSRTRDYFLHLGAGALTLKENRPPLFDRDWKKESKEAILEHITAGRTSILKLPGLWLKPKGPGNRWTVAVSPGGVAHVGSATTLMLCRALLPKARMTPNWKGDFDQKWLLVLNNYPLADGVNEVRSIVGELAGAKPELRQLDGILWSGSPDPRLVEIPLQADT